MKLLVYGAGVLGSLFAVRLHDPDAVRRMIRLMRHNLAALPTAPVPRGFVALRTLPEGLLAARPPADRPPWRSGSASTWPHAPLADNRFVPTDPALGYPPGEPGGLTANGRVHQVAGLALFAGLSAAPLSLARRTAETNRRRARLLRVCGVSVIVFAFAAGIAYRLDTLDVWRPAPAGLLEHLSLLAGFGWIIAVGLCLQRERPAAADAVNRVSGSPS